MLIFVLAHLENGKTGVLHTPETIEGLPSSKSIVWFTVRFLEAIQESLRPALSLAWLWRLCLHASPLKILTTSPFLDR